MKKLPDRKKLALSYRRYKPDYENLLFRTNRKIRALISNSEINATIKFRVKTFDSYFAKILKIQNTSRSHIRITDLLGIRIICPFLEELYHVEQLISRHFPVLEVERKGMKHSFREFGYDSIHMLIDLKNHSLGGTIPYCQPVCEIQLRSILQEAWAEVEHELIYKANVSLFNEPIKRKLASLNAILTLSDVIFQEIRDYQKQILHDGIKLRESLEEKAQSLEEISIMNHFVPPAFKAPAYDITMPMQPQSELEKLLLEGLNEHSNGRFEKAIKTYSKILRMRTNRLTRSIIYNHRGMAYFVLSDYQRSLNDFSKAFENDKKNYRCLNNRGLTNRILGNYKRALDDLNLSLEINKLQVDGHYIRALTYFDLHDYAKALTDCDEILNINPDYQPAEQLRKLISSRLFI